jgi:predicted transcriptional regulator
MDDDAVFGAQVRAGRALLGWSRDDLASRCGISRAVIARIESGTTDARASTTRAIRKTLEENGVMFVVVAGGEFGIHLKPTQVD